MYAAVRDTLGRARWLRALAGALALAGFMVAFGSGAQAVTTTYKFYSGVAPGSTYSGPYDGSVGPATLYSVTKSDPTLIPTCGGGACSYTNGDIIYDPQVFPGGMPTASAPNSAGDLVWNDLSPNFGGLGVGPLTPYDSAADQILYPDVLQVDFIGPVTLTGVATLFDTSHTDFGPGFGSLSDFTAALIPTIEFEISNDGGVSWQAVTFLAANQMSLDIGGSSFQFRQLVDPNGPLNPAFYVSALSTEPFHGGGSGSVPIPAALPLFATALTGLGLWGRRKRHGSA